MDTEILNVTLEKETKKKADEIFKKLGMTTEAAIKIFVSKAVIANGMPFSVTTDSEKFERKGDGNRGGRRDDRGGDRRGGRGGFSGRSGGGFGRRDRGHGRMGDKKPENFKREERFEADSRPKVRREKLTLNSTNS